jgi:hypothetical protein
MMMQSDLKIKTFLAIVYTLVSPFIGLVATFIMLYVAGAFFSSGYYLELVKIDPGDELGILFYTFIPIFITAIVSYVAFNLLQFVLFSFIVRRWQFILAFVCVHLLFAVVVIGAIVILGQNNLL